MQQNIKFKGDGKTRKVLLDGKELKPDHSQKIVNHSPDGFAWGYGGSGPAQLALAVCMRLFGYRKKKMVSINRLPFDYQGFKQDKIATLPRGDFEIMLNVPSILEEYKNEDYVG
jgi:hypothetical protein